ncbi:MAG TPA: glycosyltransferase family 2 protein [Roseovarius sp.]
MRLRRRHAKTRAARKGLSLRPVVDRTAQIEPDDVLLFSTLRNEDIRLPYFLEYYRRMGVDHFLIVDNDSSDGGGDYLAGQPDVSLWHTKASYKGSRFGTDWLNRLQAIYGHDHWILVVDPDEFFIYPFCDTRPIKALTDWLDCSNVRSFGAMLLDLYPKGRLDGVPYRRGQDPLEITAWFDPGNYTIEKNRKFGNLWIQGGPRARVFFADAPEKAPALNKIPLVKWHRRYAYISSTHMLLPRGLNLVYDEWGGEATSGVLLHAKFLDTFAAKAEEEVARKQHYRDSVEYRAYIENMDITPELWCNWSEKYINWRQLEILGLMSKGNWA